MRHKLFRYQRAVLTALAAIMLSAALATPAAAAPDAGQWDPTLPKVLSAGAPGGRRRRTWWP